MNLGKSVKIFGLIAKELSRGSNFLQSFYRPSY